MSDQPLFSVRATKDEKGLQLHSELAFLQHVQRLKAGEYEIAVDEWTPARSKQANKFYWKVVVGTVAEFMGEDRMVVHELLKLKCNPVVIVNKRTGEETIVGGTTRTGSKEFWDYVKRCQQFAAETFVDDEGRGLYIPDPNEEIKNAA